MKTFASHRTAKEVMALSKEQCLKFEDAEYKRGSDYVFVSGGGAYVAYNTVSGIFHGTTPDGVKFDSNSTEHEEMPWLQDFLSFFYIENESA